MASFRKGFPSRPFVVEVIRSRRERRRSSSFVPPAITTSSEREPGTLVLVRHGESEFNKQDRFTGLTNPLLTATGIQEAITVGRTLRTRGVGCDIAFTSKLKRARQTLSLILKELHAASTPAFENAALNERDYGELAGLTRTAAVSHWGAARAYSFGSVPMILRRPMAKTLR